MQRPKTNKSLVKFLSNLTWTMTKMWEGRRGLRKGGDRQRREDRTKLLLGLNNLFSKHWYLCEWVCKLKLFKWLEYVAPFLSLHPSFRIFTTEVFICCGLGSTSRGHSGLRDPLGQCVETEAPGHRRLLLGEQLLGAQLSVRFSSFNTLSFFKT